MPTMSIISSQAKKYAVLNGFSMNAGAEYPNRWPPLKMPAMSAATARMMAGAFIRLSVSIKIDLWNLKKLFFMLYTPLLGHYQGKIVAEGVHLICEDLL